MQQRLIQWAATIIGLAAMMTGIDGFAEGAPLTSMSAGIVNAQRMEAEASTGDNWLMYGRTYSEQRFSPLNQINDRNVKRLGLAWSADIASPASARLM